MHRCICRGSLKAEVPGHQLLARLDVFRVDRAPNRHVAFGYGAHHCLGRILAEMEVEALLAEHRQHGGMSALQNPTGFIRNATYDTDAR